MIADGLDKTLRLDPSMSLLGYMVRHGEITAGNKWDGWGDYDLTKEGIESAEKAGQWLSFERIGRFVSSDVPRTIHTADIIMSICGPACPQLYTDPQIRPLAVAGFTGLEKTPENVKRFEYYIQNRDEVIPDGESVNQLHDRVQVIAQYMCSPYDGKPTVVVCHNSVIKSFMNIQHIKEAVAPGGIIAVYMNAEGEFCFEICLGHIEQEVGVS